MTAMKALRRLRLRVMTPIPKPIAMMRLVSCVACAIKAPAWPCGYWCCPCFSLTHCPSVRHGNLQAMQLRR